MAKKPLHPLFKTWAQMRQRCENSNHPNYKYYGGRGITVCERWQPENNGFANFVADMGDKPSPAHSIERMNNDGNYEPENCRWATMTEQSRNRRMTSANTSGYTGVSWHKSANKWEASITINYKKIYIGIFNTKEKALKARNAYEVG